MKKRIIIDLLFCFIIVCVGISVIFFVSLFQNRDTQAKQSNEFPIPVVEFQRVSLTSVEDRLELTGSVRPWKEVTLSAEIGGKIELRKVEPGNKVRSGEVLFCIDTKLLEARLAQARAQEKLAKTEFDRIEKLRTKNVISERELDNARASLDIARAEVQTIEIQLQKSIIRAPFDGLVDRCFKEKDEFVDVGTPLVRLVQLDKVKVSVGIPERDLSYFRIGDVSRIKCDAIKDTEFMGHIHEIALTADQTTRTFKCDIEVINEQLVLKPGMITKVELIRAFYPQAIMIPIFSTFLVENQRYVALVEDNKARIRPIKTGVIQKGYVQVTEGLSPGDLLIVKGQYEVRDGETVEAREAKQ